VKANFSAPSAFSQTLPNSPCVTIGASPSTGPSDAFTFIAYDAPIRKSIGGVAAIPRLEITFTRLKRLKARGNLGTGVLYSATENIMLDLYANFGERQSSVLTMHEDDDMAL